MNQLSKDIQTILNLVTMATEMQISEQEHQAYNRLTQYASGEHDYALNELKKMVHATVITMIREEKTVMRKNALCELAERLEIDYGV